jgi:hypothetical protein
MKNIKLMSQEKSALGFEPEFLDFGSVGSVGHNPATLARIPGSAWSCFNGPQLVFELFLVNFSLNCWTEFLAP